VQLFRLFFHNSPDGDQHKPNQHKRRSRKSHKYRMLKCCTIRPQELTLLTRDVRKTSGLLSEFSLRPPGLPRLLLGLRRPQSQQYEIEASSDEGDTNLQHCDAAPTSKPTDQMFAPNA
jgi:hypothetical protein